MGAVGSDVPAQLAELVVVTDEWIDANAARFDPIDWETAEVRHLRRKAFTESAIYLYVADRLGDEVVARNLRELVERRVNDRRYRHVMLRNQRQFLKYAYGPAYAEDAGFLAPETANAVDSILDSRTVWATERTPYRMMDLWHFLQLYGAPVRNFELDAILPTSSLANPADVVEATVKDAYALTHDLLFYHNFGAGHEAFPDEPAPYDLEATITGLTLRFVAEGDLDLALELVLAGVLQRQIRPGLVRHVVSLALDEARSLGYVPGPDRDEDPGIDRGSEQSSGPAETRDAAESESATDGEPSISDAERAWRKHYHTNLVAGTAARVVATEWSDFLDARADADAGREVSADEERRLGQLLHALSEYDLSSAAEQMADLAGSPVAQTYEDAFGSAVEFLRRQRAADGTFGYWEDERTLYVGKGGDDEAFRRDLLRPTAERCERALDAVEQSGEDGD